MTSTASVLAYLPSPSQGVWYVGPLALRAYALCIIVGIVVAIWWGDRRWVARGGQPGTVLDVAVWAVPFGLIGGRLYHVLTDWQKYFGAGASPVDALKIWQGGLGIWGAVALGAVGAWIGCRRRGIPLPAFGDALAPPILLAQAIGRLGNWFNQELYGGETTLPWGLEIYERRNDAGQVAPGLVDGVSTGEVAFVVHPTFLYELLWNVAVVVLLVLIDRRFTIGHGRLFALYVAGYCAGRFWIELMRTDPATEIGGIRINSFTSGIVFVLAVAYVIFGRKGREDPASLSPATATEGTAEAAPTADEKASDGTEAKDSGETEVKTDAKAEVKTGERAAKSGSPDASASAGRVDDASTSGESEGDHS